MRGGGPEANVGYLGETDQAVATTPAISTNRDRLFRMMSAVIIGLYGCQAG